MLPLSVLHSLPQIAALLPGDVTTREASLPAFFRPGACPTATSPKLRTKTVAMPLRLTIEDGEFRDDHGRLVVLRGINVAGDSKLPSEPNLPSHRAERFFEGDGVSFHKRPFTKDAAPAHFAALRRFGFNTIRYVFVWEALEHAGPGTYDEEFIEHTIDVLREAKAYGFYVFMDPHQDVWSRFTGGSGAPLWTLYACGLNPRSFAATEAAIVHNTYPEPESFPKMIWSTNYFRLAVATVNTLFFAGRDFAPKCIIDGMNIQDYLQTHFVNACGHLAKRIREAGDLQDEVVMGWESLNEPNRGLVGHVDLTMIPKNQHLKKGTSPTFWQAFLTGMGRACEIDTWDMGSLGPYHTGKALVDPHGEIAWLPSDHDDSRYGWKRHPDWKLGECIWAQHGVWDPSTDTILRRDYFFRHPKTGNEIDYATFTNTYFLEFYRKFKKACRAHHESCIMFLHYPVLELPPLIKGTADDDPKTAFTPHFYDGITLMTKHWNSMWNVDVLGVLRGKYWHPAFAIKIGETAIRNCLKDQLALLRQEGIERMGKRPCVLSEYGIPFDMDDKKAYKSGDYSSQASALDANCFAAEGANLEGHFLWVYCAVNSHKWGDQWDGEDLSIVSLDDRLPPASGASETLDQFTPSLVRLTKPGGDMSDDGSVTPANLQRALTNPSIGSAPSSEDWASSHTVGGYRAAEAFIRPTPRFVCGTVISHGFDLRNCVFHLTVSATRPAADDAPTTIYMPEFHFPKDTCQVTVSAGKWELVSEEQQGTLLPWLKWWHPQGEQTVTVEGVVRNVNVPAGLEEEDGYIEQCRRGTGVNLSDCAVM